APRVRLGRRRLRALPRRRRLRRRRRADPSRRVGSARRRHRSELQRRRRDDRAPHRRRGRLHRGAGERAEGLGRPPGHDREDARLHTNLGGPERSRGSSSKEQTDKAIAFVTHHASERWFLWVHYYDPHADYEPHPEVPTFGTDDVARYDGEIEFTDRHIGRL